jgi:glycosyltransferase domain-containing protein
MNLSDVTIVLPTFRRPDYLLRTIRYYRDRGYKGAILIGDSSNELTRSGISEFLHANKILNICYINCEHIDVIDTQYILMGKVVTKYVAFCGDDDYLIPSSIERCIDFLDNNKDYSCASGRMVTYTLSGYGSGKDSYQGAVTNFWEYYIPSIEHATASERLGYYSLHNPLISYSVFRTAQRAEPFRYENVVNKDSSLLNELVPNFCSLISGKLKSFDHLHAFRQSGSQHLTNPSYPNGLAPEIIDWILTPKFAESFNFYMDIAPAQLARMDQIDDLSARKIVKKQFQASCGSHLLFPMFNVYKDPLPWFPDHEELRQCYRSVYGEYDRTVPPENVWKNGKLISIEVLTKRPRILLITQRWNGGAPEGGTSASSWGLAETLVTCEQIDSTVLYTDQIWHDYDKTTDEYLADVMQTEPQDCVVISSQVLNNPPRQSTLQFLKHSSIPVVIIWETPFVEPLSSYYQNSDYNVITVAAPDTVLPNQVKLWPPTDFQAFHDPGLERDLAVYCLGDVLNNPGSLFEVQRLVEAGIELHGIRDWRFEHFIQKGQSLDEARTFRSSLFDPAFYLDTYQVNLPQGMDALTHYMQFGWQLNYNPNPLFDTAYYRSRYPDSESDETNPLLHFVNTPVHQGCAPHPYFDSLYYLAHYPDVAASGMNPLEHYLNYGVAEGKRSCAPMGKHEYARQLKRSRIALSFRGDQIIRMLQHACLLKPFCAVPCCWSRNRARYQNGSRLWSIMYRIGILTI